MLEINIAQKVSSLSENSISNAIDLLMHYRWGHFSKEINYGKLHYDAWKAFTMLNTSLYSSFAYTK